MDRTGLECFVALAEELHFSRAAERCHISQPAMSQQILRLERALDVRLAHRNKRSVSLTRAGEVFLAEARKVLRQMDDAAALTLRTDRGEVGQLTVGVTSPALYVVYPEIAALFRARLPNVGLVVRELTTAEQEHALRRGDLDVGVVHPPLDDAGLAVEEIGRAPFQLALPEGHPLTAHESLELGDLEGEQVVIFPRQIAPQLYDTVLLLCREAGFSLKIAMEAHPAQSIIALVAAGLGLGFIASETQRLTRAGVVYRPIRGPRPQLGIGVAYHADGIAPAVRTFVHAAREAGASMH
ncbi:LysR family transcriptional regulator [Amycolatopsis sp. NPDC005232]|uniref:LysR family transcriptional regulator n=1 Tax=unclassified Amycolatopsis TaxID=2618356 RepID=UPI001C69A7BF|nr:LysR family transcriptional regulator [Amycolatopsis sp. DSM 110486]QYN18136.1 LysR family transcriptional regulator [Amycolatopsis sp. DSM 110486]